MNPLLELIEHGQSYWLDNLTRRMIRTGELERRVEEEGLRGVTSNPDIFNRAISGGEEYDEQIRELVGDGLPVEEICERLMIQDVQDACDVLHPVFDASGGTDGFVSIEVSPYLVHDTEGTITEARRLFQEVARPNVLVKIPGSPAGVPAIEQMLYEGVNINITLLFSIASYEAVAEAYLRALERRLEESRAIDGVASVASFFLSRIDVLVDQLLGHRIVARETRGGGVRPEELLGRAAVANAKLAYRSFQRLFGSERWARLEEKGGARVQRVLWASTSTKNPLYDDVRYVEPLIGPHTINTMPDRTIEAFADHGRAATTVEDDMEEAAQVLDALEEVGIDFEAVTWQLLNEGTQKFVAPYDKLMSTLEKQREAILGRPIAGRSFVDGKPKASVSSALEALDECRFGRRLQQHDPTLWTAAEKTAAAIRERLGWLDAVERFAPRTDELADLAAEIAQEEIRHVVHLGMGGSSLCPEVAAEVFGAAPGRPELLVLDDTDPTAVAAVEAAIDPASTLFIVASKSGTTTETMSFYRTFWERAEAALGEAAKDHFLAITDAGTPLAEEARERGFRRLFENPADVGGRYSALTYFGLVPMALLGVDVAELLARARQMALACGSHVPAGSNPGLELGGILGGEAKAGRDKVTFVADERLAPFGMWAEQLLAESTGKEGRGLVPVDGEHLAGPKSYGSDRLFVALTIGEPDGETAERLDALAAAGHPVVRLSLGGPPDLGAEMLRWEVATAVAGAILRINPFDEPNVAESKRNTRNLLEEWQEKGDLPKGEPVAADDTLELFAPASLLVGAGIEGGAGDGGGVQTMVAPAAVLRALIAAIEPGDYLALLPYVRRTPARHEALDALRHELRDRLRVATTLGYGPRYLHSTGQLHKGGPASGVFLLLTAESGDDVAIPGSAYGFATLHRAQALGDYRALVDHGRRVVHVHLKSAEVEQGVETLARMF